MSDSFLNNSNLVKCNSDLKYILNKTTHSALQNPSLLLLTVQYPQNVSPKATEYNHDEGIVMDSQCMQQQHTILETEKQLSLNHLIHPLSRSKNVEESEDFSSGEEEPVQIISDKPVTCRAVASLPAKFLFLEKVFNKSSAKTGKGVFAKTNIPRRAQFGPIEGVLNETNNPNQHLILSIESSGTFEYLDVSNENTSNWMRYVRCADSVSDQNLCLHQIGKKLFFRVERKIAENDELRVWYSKKYARARNLPVLSSRYKKLNKGNYDSSQSENVTTSEKNSDLNEWRCSHCHKVFRSAATFNLHVLTHAADNIETKENSVNNEVSSSTSFQEPDNTSHRETNKSVSCNKCGKTFSNNSALIHHVNSHEGLKTFDCPICKQIFNKVLQLKKHIMTHSVGGFFSCPYCSKKYQEYRHIRNHIRRFHCKKNYGCLQCSKCFSTLDKLRLHMLSHSDHREFSCVTCGKQFKRRDKLSVHVRKAHVTSTIPNETSTKPPNENKSSQNKQVAESDYSEYVYKCHLCVVGFKRRGMLVNHLANRHPEVTPDSVPELNLPILKANKDYYCQYCDKIYKSSSKRKAHILKNHPGKKLPLSNRKIPTTNEGSENATYSQTVGSVTANPQSCDWCYKQYASKAKLLQHQRKKHLNQLPRSLQHPKKSNSVHSEEDTDSIRDAIEKVMETGIFLPENVDMSEYEASGDNRFLHNGEIILDASTLKRAIKGEVLALDCSPATLAELGQLIENRPESYFKVYQAPTGITFAQPVEVWDPLQLCLSPAAEITQAQTHPQ